MSSPPQPKVSDAKVVSTEPLAPSEARWIRAVKKTYVDPLKQTRTWESAERTTRPADSEVDGVGIIAILEKDTGPELLLQKQFRPPVDKVCIEIPAGLIDQGESPDEAAVRELKEETGYVGTVMRDEKEGKGLGKGVMFNDPGFTNTNTLLIHIHIDLHDPANQASNLKPELEDNEFIEIFSIPVETLWAECRKLEAEGYVIDARVGGLAEGVRLAGRLGLGRS